MRERNELVEKDEKIKRGKKNPLNLTQKTRQEIALGIYNAKMITQRHRFFRKDFTEEENRGFAYQFLFYAIVQPYSILTTKHSGMRLFSFKKILKNYKYSTEFFSYLEYGDQLIYSSFEYLHKENIIEVIRRNNDDILFDLKDGDLRNFVNECKAVFDKEIILRMYNKWQNIRNPNTEEYNWLKLIFGERKARDKFSYVSTNLKNNKTSLKYTPKYKKEKMELINFLDISIYNDFNRIITKYKKIKDDYPSLFEVIIETVCPKFYYDYLIKCNKLKELENNNIRNPKRYNRFRNIKKINSVSFCGSVVLTDKTRVGK